MRTPDEHLHTSRITHHASQEEQGNRVFGTDIEFAYPWVLAGLIAVPLLWLVAARLRPERLRGGAVLATLGPLVVALARPQTVKADARVETQGIDIVLAFDISGSMLEPGLGMRTKMDGAKKALKDFINGRENDRIGL